MKNAFSRIGRTCALAAITGGLMASALLATPVNEVTVTLPHAVVVGSKTLPSGDYTISNLRMDNGDEYFLIRSSHGEAVTLQAQKIDSEEQDKTSVVFSTEGATWHFDKLFIQGENTGYQFQNVK